MHAFVGVGWWLLFGLLIALLVGFDLLVVHRKDRDPSILQSALTVTVWFLLALGFNGFVWWLRGGQAAVQFAAGYLLEWSMSMDNVFVFAVIFRYFQVPKEHQYRILFWGIIGAVLMRLAFILAGAAMISWAEGIVLPLFGLFLIYTSYRLAWHSAEQIDPSQSLVFRLARRWLPTEGGEREAGSDAPSDLLPAPGSLLPAYSGRFLVREQGRLRITPLLVVLLIVETTDLLFAVDSIPAIFGITRDSFIVFTSNVFAILGLRALYFLLAGMMDSFRYLHYGLAAVLGFVGLKMVAEGWLPRAAGTELLPAWASLLVIVGLLGVAIVASIAAGKKGD
jgi:tellurite resistance protein TerC